MLQAEPASHISVEDLDLLDQFQSLRLPYESWCHRLHVRVAYLLLRLHPFEEAVSRFRVSIQAYNQLHQVPDHLTSGYHETLTVAWFRLIASRITDAAGSLDSHSFLAEQPDLLEKSLLRQFYSRERIVSWEAKRVFVEPDQAELPPAGAG